MLGQARRGLTSLASREISIDANNKPLTPEKEVMSDTSSFQFLVFSFQQEATCLLLKTEN
jgi:hypothetical protein